MSFLRNIPMRLTLLAILGGVVSTAGADTLRMDGTVPGADDGRPSRGMTQARVEAKFGSPAAKRAAVGDPPISRWEYPNMIVYFEYDRVIHAVVKR